MRIPQENLPTARILAHDDNEVVRSASEGLEQITLGATAAHETLNDDDNSKVTNKQTKKKRWISLPGVYKLRGRKMVDLAVSTSDGRAKDTFQGTVNPPEPPADLLARLRWKNRPLDVHMSPGSPRSERQSPVSTSDNESCDYLESPFLDDGTNVQNWAPGPYGLYFKCRTTDAVSEPPHGSELTENLTACRASCPALVESVACRLQSEDGAKGQANDQIGNGKTNISRTRRTWPRMRSRPSSTLSLPALATETSKPNPVPDLYDPVTKELVLPFSSMRPRSVRLKRRQNKKHEIKALWTWRETVRNSLFTPSAIKPSPVDLPRSKKERDALTRQFIFRELYTTEITFWNQLLYAKVMFNDPMYLALERSSPFVRPTDTDWFANLDDLMQYSSRLVRTLQYVQTKLCLTRPMTSNALPLPPDSQIGYVLRSHVERMVVFLRCALDYKTNQKQSDIAHANKGYALYSEKLALRRETRQFELRDYFIIPIQRVTRYELLLADLLRHTDTTHPDYHNIVIAHKIITGLATAMNRSQR